MSDFAEGNVIQDDDAVQGALDRLETQFRDLHKQVESLQRLAGLGTICSMIAHECNNVMTPIISYCQYALRLGDMGLMHKALERTLKNAQKLTDLCGVILNMATGASDESGAVNVRSAVNDAIACLGRDLEKDSITSTLDIPDSLTVKVPASSLQQVLFNLILNARQAMLDRPGRLTISARLGDDNRVQLDVTDTGCGIKPDDLKKIFEPFFSTKRHESRPDRGGAGLGLHVCKRLMTAAGGDITVASKPGEGTTFTLTLPSGA
jgi:signal transduction histidine kinase